MNSLECMNTDMVTLALAWYALQVSARCFRASECPFQNHETDTHTYLRHENSSKNR